MVLLSVYVVVSCFQFFFVFLSFLTISCSSLLKRDVEADDIMLKRVQFGTLLIIQFSAML